MKPIDTLPPPALMTLAQNKRAYRKNTGRWRNFALPLNDVLIVKCYAGASNVVYVAYYDGVYLGMLLVHQEHGNSVTTGAIDHVYVIDYVRRKGVARLLHKRATEDYRILTTGHGSEAGGEALLRALGYVYDETFGNWRYISLSK